PVEHRPVVLAEYGGVQGPAGVVPNGPDVGEALAADEPAVGAEVPALGLLAALVVPELHSGDAGEGRRLSVGAGPLLLGHPAAGVGARQGAVDAVGAGRRLAALVEEHFLT